MERGFCRGWIVCQTSPIQLLSYTQRGKFRIVAKIELYLWQLHSPHIGNLFLSCLEFAPLKKKKSLGFLQVNNWVIFTTGEHEGEAQSFPVWYWITVPSMLNRWGCWDSGGQPGPGTMPWKMAIIQPQASVAFSIKNFSSYNPLPGHLYCRCRTGSTLPVFFLLPV